VPDVNTLITTVLFVPQTEKVSQNVNVEPVWSISMEPVSIVTITVLPVMIPPTTVSLVSLQELTPLNVSAQSDYTKELIKDVTNVTLSV
jgi:hypothetical protein